MYTYSHTDLWIIVIFSDTHMCLMVCINYLLNLYELSKADVIMSDETFKKHRFKNKRHLIISRVDLKLSGWFLHVISVLNSSLTNTFLCLNTYFSQFCLYILQVINKFDSWTGYNTNDW